MAIVRTGGGVTDIRGSIAGNTFSRGRSGLIARARTVPVNPRSSSQSKSRAKFASLNELWHSGLSTSQQTAWTTYANAVAAKNRLGESIHLTGQLHFVRSNQSRMTAGLPLITDGPTILALPEADPSIIITTSSSTQKVTITFDANLPWVSENNAGLIISQGIPQPRTRNYYTHPWHYAAIIPGSAGTPPTPPFEFTSHYVIGGCQRLWFSLSIIRADGRATNPFTVSCLSETEPVSCLANYPIASHPCNDKDVWTSYLTTRENDPTYHLCSEPKARSVKITMASPAGTEGWIDYLYSAPQNFLDPQGKAPFVLARFYIHPGSGDSAYTTISSMVLYFGNSAFTSHFRSEIAKTAYLRTGWNSVLYAPQSWTPTGTPLWSAIQKIRLRIITTAVNKTPSITLDEIRLVPRPRKPSLFFTMDDGNDDQLTVANYLSSKGLVGTFYVIPSTIGTANRLTLANLITMKGQGHLIANHSYAHWTWNEHTDAEMIADIEAAKTWLIANGFANGSRIWAMPGGPAYFPSNGKTLLIGTILDSIRLTSWMPDVINKGSMPYRPDFIATDYYDSVTNADISLTAALADNSRCTLLFHRSTGAGYTWPQLQTFIDRIATEKNAGNLLVRTPADVELLPI